MKKWSAVDKAQLEYISDAWTPIDKYPELKQWFCGIDQSDGPPHTTTAEFYTWMHTHDLRTYISMPHTKWEQATIDLLSSPKNNRLKRAYVRWKLEG